MILIKDRHQKYPFPGMEPNSGKYDTYKGSTHERVININFSIIILGNMILIKDRHPSAIEYPRFHFPLGKYDTYKGSTLHF